MRAQSKNPARILAGFFVYYSFFCSVLQLAEIFLLGRLIYLVFPRKSAYYMFRQTLKCSIEAFNIDSISQCDYSHNHTDGVQFENFHEQLPLPVPCYDLLPVIEFTVGRINTDFEYPQFP